MTAPRLRRRRPQQQAPTPQEIEEAQQKPRVSGRLAAISHGDHVWLAGMHGTVRLNMPGEVSGELPPRWRLSQGRCTDRKRMVSSVVAAVVDGGAGEKVVGSAPDVSELSVVVPTHWGSRRRTELDTLTKGLAQSVRQIDFADAAAAAFDAAHKVPAQPGRWLVVECRTDWTTLTAVEAGAIEIGPVQASGTGSELHLDVGSGEDDLPRKVSELVAAWMSRGPEPPHCDEILVGGDLAPDISATVVAALGERFGTYRVRAISPQGMLAAQLRPRPRAAARSFPPVRGDLLRPDRTPWWDRRRLTPVILSLISAGLVGAGAYVVADQSVDPRYQPSAAPPVAPVPEPAEVAMGAVHVQMPPGWRVRTNSPRTDTEPGRLELKATAGPDRQIVVTQRVLVPGATAQDVVSDLASQLGVGGHDSRYGALELALSIGGRNVIGYRESPDVYSQIRWFVLLDGGYATSVGCQFLVGDWASVAGECAAFVEHMKIG